MPFLMAAALVLALATGSYTGWRTQAQMAEDERRQRGQSPTVQGGGGRWFYWYIHYMGGSTPYGAVYMTDQEAFQNEFNTKAQFLGAQMHRYVWTGGRWVRDTRSDTQFLASAPIPGASVAGVGMGTGPAEPSIIVYPWGPPDVAGHGAHGHVIHTLPAVLSSVTMGEIEDVEDDHVGAGISIEQARAARDALLESLGRQPWLRGIGLGLVGDSHVVHAYVHSITDEVCNALPKEIHGVPVQVQAIGDVRPQNVGAVPVTPPIRGQWTAPGFPEVVTLQGRSFRKAQWKWPRTGVVAQYRETVPVNSHHLLVLADGTFIIDHYDEANPDCGRAIEHLVKDVLKRPTWPQAPQHAMA